jgi:hypothetical protein
MPMQNCGLIYNGNEWYRAACTHAKEAPGKPWRLFNCVYCNYQASSYTATLVAGNPDRQAR